MSNKTLMLFATLVAVCYSFVLLGLVVIFPLVAALELSPIAVSIVSGVWGGGITAVLTLILRGEL